jgi:hypothetical protein
MSVGYGQMVQHQQDDQQYPQVINEEQPSLAGFFDRHFLLLPRIERFFKQNREVL